MPFFYTPSFSVIASLQDVLVAVQTLSLCPTLCDLMDGSTPGSSVLYYLLEFAQIHVHWVGDDIQPFHPLLFPSPLAFYLSQHQCFFFFFQRVCSLHQVAKVLVLQLQHQPFQWIVRTLCSPRDSQESSPTPQFKSVKDLCVWSWTNYLNLSELQFLIRNCDHGGTVTWFIGCWWQL